MVRVDDGLGVGVTVVYGVVVASGFGVVVVAGVVVVTPVGVGVVWPVPVAGFVHQGCPVSPPPPELAP